MYKMNSANVERLRWLNKEIRQSVAYDTLAQQLQSKCGCYHGTATTFWYCDEHHEEYLETLVASTPKPKQNSQKADPDTSYAFTLTIPPTYQCKKPLEEVAQLILKNGLTNKPYEKASRWAYVLEHTESGTPHIHGMYQTPSGRRISNKYFERYHPLWDEKVKLGHGHKGGYHQKTRHNESYEAYMTKEGCVHSSAN